MKGSLVNRADLDDKDESHNADRSTATVSNVVNHIDFADTDVVAPPPLLSRQEPVRVTAPRVTFHRAQPRMIVDVDEFMDVENKEDITQRTEDDDSIPSALPYPQRSASQKAAIAAVLGRDDDDDDDDNKGCDLHECDEKRKGASVTDCTADLSEDEIAAVVPPNLQRHTGGRNVTPGAFSVPGRGSVALNRRGSTRRSQTEELDVGGDGIHMISATLVDADAPVLVYAERLWWKRRLVWCVSAWMLFAVTVVSVSITIAIRLTSRDPPSSNTPPSNPPPPETVSFEADESANTTIVPTKMVASRSPSASPIVASPPPTALATMISMHAASWGVLTSCSDFNDEFESYEMVFSCVGGRIKLEREENVECQKSAGDQRKLSCRLKSSGTHIDALTTNVYQNATGLALFSCRDTLSAALLGTGQLLNVSVPNCSSSFSTFGTASTFVSMARFCQEGDDLEFRDVFNDCVVGEKCFVGTPSLPLCAVANEDDNQDGRFRTNDFFNDFIDEAAKFVDEAISFCYETTSGCNNQTANSGECSLSVPDVTSENTPAFFEICGDPANSEEDIDSMWMTSKEKLDPSKRMEVIVQDIL